MKVSHKISFLVIFLLAALAGNTYFGLSQLSKIGDELKDVASQDIELTETVTSLTQRQLEKAVLFERAIRIAEEIGYEDISPARKDHLLANAKVIKDGFDQLAHAGALQIIRGKEVIQKGKQSASDPQRQKEIVHAGDIISEIESAHILYDGLVKKILDVMREEGFQLSLEDIEAIQKKERSLTRKLKTLLSEVQGYTRHSLQRAEEKETLTNQSLRTSLLVSILVGIILAFLIIRNIAQPLKRLEDAAHKVGEGKFDIHLDDSSKDEIGEVSSAFNTMSQRISEARNELATINRNLSDTLEVTENQKKDLEKVNRELDRFVHTISHDIRSPLMGVSGYGSILNNVYKKKLDARAKKCIEGICQGAKRIEDMIRDLLELTRISRVQNPYEVVHTGDLVESVKGQLEYKIKESEAEVTVAENMPAIECDRIKLSVVFFNLINNAIKFSSKGKSAPKIEVTYQDQGEVHQFSVKDNGIGINPQDHDKVFEIFRRLDTAETIEGTGAGLSIVKEIIADHGGKIWIDSRGGSGATFLFTIPKNLLS